MFGSINKALFPPAPTESSETHTTNLFTTEYNTIRKELSDLTEKVNVLCSMNKNLQQEIKSTATSIAQVPATLH